MYQAYPEILDGFELPEGMDNETLRLAIFEYAGENEVRYSNPELLAKLINAWFERNKSQFGRIWFTINADYNPIENYDRKECFLTKDDNVTTDRHTGTESNERKGTVTNERSGTNTIEETGTETTQNSGNETSAHEVAGYDSNDFVNAYKDTHTPNVTETRTPNITKTETPNITETQTPDITETRTPDLEDKRTENLERINSGRAHGNIGVTTTQAMIEEERRVAQYDIYRDIALKFETEFTIPVYGRCYL